MGHRKVWGLRHARLLDERPRTIPKGRPRGAKAMGVRYEKALGEALGEVAESGRWFEFEDLNGRGYCQTDFLISLPDRLIVLECKYTWTHMGHLQMEELYFPVIRQMTKKKVSGIVVCKNLLPLMNGIRVVHSLDEALEVSATGVRTAWQWIGIPALAGLAA